MELISYDKLIAETTSFKFVRICEDRLNYLDENQYYALMVTDEVNKYTSPHVKGIDPITHHALVGIEKTGRKDPKEGHYISKDFYKRKNALRGVTVLVEVDDIEKCCII